MTDPARADRSRNRSIRSHLANLTEGRIAVLDNTPCVPALQLKFQIDCRCMPNTRGSIARARQAHLCAQARANVLGERTRTLISGRTLPGRFSLSLSLSFYIRSTLYELMRSYANLAVMTMCASRTFYVLALSLSLSLSFAHAVIHITRALS